MIRLIFDECGDGHEDIFLKIDAMPSFLKVADTYFISGFFNREYETSQEIILDYLSYFKKHIQELDDREEFIPFDLSDQYIGGLFMTQVKNGLVKVKYEWTDQIEGFGVSEKTVTSRVRENRISFKIEYDWLLSKDAIMEGLSWSIKKINSKA